MVSYLLPESHQWTHISLPTHIYEFPHNPPTTYLHIAHTPFPISLGMSKVFGSQFSAPCQDITLPSCNFVFLNGCDKGLNGSTLPVSAISYPFLPSELPSFMNSSPPQPSFLDDMDTTTASSLFTILAADLTHQFWHGQAYSSTLEFRFFIQYVLNTTQISTTTLLLALKLIHTMKLRQPSLCGAPGSECRVFTVGLILANKTLEDNNFTNKTWSKVTGLPSMEINQMEMEFLQVLDWRCIVSQQDYLEWRSLLENYLLSYDLSMLS
ncbi:hypothetical protein K7432_005494 [Basidiobolus ranarum]|uniref:Cyclin N-terminal domain-containing protein n=1 Tax=Basidiobolus ranarum TaxID=34480 RepID=A0ABR2WWI2_9FUNG